MSCAGYGAGDLIAAAWAERVVDNGGNLPAATTIAAAATFLNSLNSGGILTMYKTINIFAPDSLYAARTPLIRNYGLDPYTEVNGSGDITAAGWSCAGVTNRYLNTGIDSTTAFANNTSFGLTIYISVMGGNNTFDIGYWGASGQTGIQYDQCDFYNFDSGRVANGGNLAVGGYLSGNRTAVNSLKNYWANSTNAHAERGSNTGNNTTARQNYPIGINAAPPIQNNNVRRFSYAAVHEGFTQAQSLIQYNAVQALRVALGGGWI